MISSIRTQAIRKLARNSCQTQIHIYILISTFYSKIMALFCPTAQDLKRFEAKSRSLIYTHFGEALKGVETIRSFPNSSRQWSSDLRSLIDKNLSVIYTVKALDRWLSICLESLGNIVVLTAAFMMLCTHNK